MIRYNILFTFFRQGALWRCTHFSWRLFFPRLCLADIHVISWNLESGGSNINSLIQRLRTCDDINFYSLSEVLDQWETPLLQAVGTGESITYASILGTTGGAERLQIIFNASRYRLISSDELDDINIGGRVRATLRGRFEETSSGNQVIVIVNHLYRSNDERRHTQAARLNNWVRTQDVPVIAMGDYNFDWDVLNGDQDHDEGFDNMVQDDVFVWVRPESLIRTQCDLNYNSVLDFVFISGALRDKPHQSTILFPEADYCTSDLNNRSDHRPVYALIIESDDGQPNLRAEILQSIGALRQQLDALEELAQSIPGTP